MTRLESAEKDAALIIAKVKEKRKLEIITAGKDN